MAAFGKRHYEAVAKALLSSRPPFEDRKAYAQWERSCLAFINHFERDNPGFKAQQFMTACTGEKHERR